MTLLYSKSLDENLLFEAMWDLITKVFAWISLFSLPLFFFFPAQEEESHTVLIVFIGAVVFSFAIMRFHNQVATLISELLIPTATIACIAMLDYSVSTNLILFLSVFALYGLLYCAHRVSSVDNTRIRGILSHILFPFIHISFALAIVAILPSVGKFNIFLFTKIISLDIELAFVILNVLFLMIGFLITYIQLFLLNKELIDAAKKLQNVSSWSIDESALKKILDDKYQKPDKKFLYILIGDIRGFTAFTESHPVELVVQTLQNFYYVVESIISKHNGYKPEFIADEFITFFDTPKSALNCALEIRTNINIFLHEYKLSAGLALNAGEVLVGIIGGQTSKKFTLIGRAVNVAARLQSKAKGWQILTTRDFLKHCPEAPHSEIGYSFLKGINDPMPIYQILSKQSLGKKKPPVKRKKHLTIKKLKKILRKIFVRKKNVSTMKK